MLKEFLLVIALPATVLSSIIFFVGEVHGSYQCNNYSDMTGKNVKYIIFDICYIETEDGWQRYDEYKSRNIGRDSLEVFR